MEIPTVKLEIYDRNPSYFSQQLSKVLEDFGVAQVDGLEQRLVDDLYGYMQEHAENFNLLSDQYLGKQVYRQEFLDSYFGIKPKVLRKNQYLNGLIKDIRKNVSKIRDKTTSALSSIYGPIEKSQDLFLFRYYQKPGLFYPNRKMAIDKHIDDGRPLVFALPASAPGLEGKIKGRWRRLRAEPGHLLIWTGDEKITKGKIKALQHRIQYPPSERLALLYG